MLALGIPTFYFLKSLKDPTGTPMDATEHKLEEYGRVDRIRIGLHVGLVDFMLFVSYFHVLANQHPTRIQFLVEYGR